MKTQKPARGSRVPAASCRCAGTLVTIAVSLLLMQAPRLMAQGGAAGRELIALDFSKSPLGDPPKELRVTRGKLEIVEKDGTHMLKSGTDSTFIVTVPEKIPNHFALEFDFVPRSSGYTTGPTELSFEGTRDVSHSDESAHVLWGNNRISVIGGGQAYAGGQIDMPEDLKEEVIGFLTKIRAEFNEGSLTVQTNGRTVFESKTAKFLRGRVVRVQLGGNDEDENAVYLASMRLLALDGGAGAKSQASQSSGAAANRGNDSGKGSTQQQQAASGDNQGTGPTVTPTVDAIEPTTGAVAAGEPAEPFPVEQPDNADTDWSTENGMSDPTPVPVDQPGDADTYSTTTGSTAEETAPGAVTGIAVRVADNGNVWVSWDMIEDALSYFAICWDTEVTRSFQVMTSPDYLSNGWEAGVLPAAGNYAVRVFAKVGNVYVTGETVFTYGGATNQQTGTTGSSPPSTGSTSEEAAPKEVTGLVVRVNDNGSAWVSWDLIEEALSYFAMCWDVEVTHSFQLVSPPEFLSNGWEAGVLPAPGNYAFRVFAKLPSGGYVSGETVFNYGGAANPQAGTSTGGTQPVSNGSTGGDGTGTTGTVAPATGTRVVLRVNSDGGAVGMWDAVPDAISYVPVLWNATDQNAAPWVTSSQDFNNARMLPGSNSTGWQIGILPSQGTYVLRVYATTASGGVASGEAQVNFTGASNEQAGTIEAATPATDTAVVFNINSDGGAWATWDPVPGAISYFAIVWNATNQNVMPWVTNSQDFKNARMLPDNGSTGWQIGILPSPGTYVFRVYAKTADGYAVGEAQAQFSGAATQQTGTNGTGATGGSVQDPGAQTGQVVQTGSYKVTVTGLSVYNPTNEDPSISDGAGDEALVCAVVTYMDRTTSSEISFGQIQSVDYGDVADGRYAGRVRAGRASQTGGLRGQDVVPDGFDPAAPLSGTPQPEHLPLVMWEGSLTAGREIVILIPSVWEHDGARDAVNSYFNNWQACSRSELLSSLPVQASLSDGRIGASEAVFFPEILNSPAATSFATPPWTGYKLAASVFKAGVDRPIGFESMPGEPDTLKFGERFVVITQEKVASLQVGQAITVPVRFTESTGTSIGGGDYRVFVRVERTK